MSILYDSMLKIVPYTFTMPVSNFFSVVDYLNYFSILLNKV